MMLDLAYLEDFLALAQTGNFSRAALQRAVTQPAFSRRIKALEAWAGARLFARDAQPIALTEAGRALHPIVIDVLRDLHQGRERVRTLASRGRSTLRFVATHVLSFTFFPAWLRGLDSGQPLDAVELVSDSLEACEQLMLRGQGHFLLCHAHHAVPARLDPAEFPWRRLGADVLCPVSAPDEFGHPCHDLTSTRPIQHLASSAASGLGRIVGAAGPATSARLNVVFTSHLAAVLRTMALGGHGVAWLPLSLVSDDLAHGKLVRAAPDAMEIALEIRLVRAAFDLGVAAEAFWRRLETALPPAGAVTGAPEPPTP